MKKAPFYIVSYRHALRKDLVALKEAYREQNDRKFERIWTKVTEKVLYRKRKGER